MITKAIIICTTIIVIIAIISFTILRYKRFDSAKAILTIKETKLRRLVCYLGKTTTEMDKSELINELSYIIDL